MSNNKNILILGGGFGGLRVALELARQSFAWQNSGGFARRHEAIAGYDIVLVDRQSHHLYTPLLYEVASSFLQDEKPREDFCVRNGVCVDFAFLQRVATLRSVRFVRGEVTAIDAEKQEVRMGRERLLYAYLVVALGAVTEDFGIPGVRKYGFTFKTMADAMLIHGRINELLARHRKGREKKVTIVIGGGGATGVELAAELSSFCMRACAKYDLRFNDFQITIAEANNRLLGPSDPKVSVWARERLQHLGVDVSLDTCVKIVKKGSVVLTPRPLREGENAHALLCDFRGESEKEIEADVFIWSGGIRAPEVLQKSELLLDAKGRVDVHDTLLAKGKENVFALGDCAALLDPKTNRVVPALAQVAMHEAVLVAENIRRSIAGRHLHPYTYPSLASLIPAGGKYAFGEFGVWHLRGVVMWVVRRLADLRYFFSILPFRDALRTWWNGWKMYTKND